MQQTPMDTTALSEIQVGAYIRSRVALALPWTLCFTKPNAEFQFRRALDNQVKQEHAQKTGGSDGSSSNRRR